MVPHDRLPYEKEFEVTPIGVKYICEFCEKGEMHLNPDSRLHEPALYEHICDCCNAKMMLPRIYPYIDWIPVNKEMTE